MESNSFCYRFSTNDRESTFPKPGDVYQLDWDRPFFETDTLRFSIESSDSLDVVGLRKKNGKYQKLFQILML